MHGVRKRATRRVWSRYTLFGDALSLTLLDVCQPLNASIYAWLSSSYRDGNASSDRLVPVRRRVPLPGWRVVHLRGSCFLIDRYYAW